MDLISDPSGSKIARYEHFVNDVLKEHLKMVLTERDAVFELISEYLGLQKMLTNIVDMDLGTPISSKADLGCNFYVNCKIQDLDQVFVKVGLGFYLQMNGKEAIEFAQKKMDLLTKRANALTSDAHKIRTLIRSVLETLKTLQFLGDPPES